MKGRFNYGAKDDDGERMLACDNVVYDSILEVLRLMTMMQSQKALFDALAIA